MNFLDVNNTAFELLNYQMSWIELIGTILYLVSTILVARKNMLTWPISIISTALYAYLFWQINLYADFIEQFYFIFASIVGWWLWNKNKTNNIVVIKNMNIRQKFYWFIIILVCTFIFTNFLYIAPDILPQIFPAAAEFPFLDALTTVMSFVAMILMNMRFLQSWYLWIVVDIIAIGLYWFKDVKLISILYIILLINAFYGLYVWKRN